MAVLGRALPDEMAMNGEALGSVKALGSLEAGPGGQKPHPSRRGACAARLLFFARSLVHVRIPDFQVSLRGHVVDPSNLRGSTVVEVVRLRVVRVRQGIAIHPPETSFDRRFLFRDDPGVLVLSALGELQVVLVEESALAEVVAIPFQNFRLLLVGLDVMALETLELF